jgi:hypothetical protein
MFSQVRWWLIGCAVPVGLGAVSWHLAGGPVWGTVTGITVLFLLFFGLGMLKYLGEMTGRHWAVCGYVVLCCACWTVVGCYYPLTTVTVKPVKDGPRFQTRIRYDGKLLPPFDSSEGFSYQFRGRLQSDLLKVETLGPQGWDEIRPGAAGVRVYGNEVVLGSLPTSSLYVDNKGNDAIEVACGEVKFKVAAGARERLAVLTPPPGSRIPLTLDGEEVGVLDGDHVLIDVTGSRTYRFRELVYSAGVDPAWLNPNHVPDRLPTPDIVIEPGYVHKLPRKLDYFLSPPPPTITITTIQGNLWVTETRTELVQMY